MGMNEAVGSAISAFAGAAASGQVSIDEDAARDALTEIANIKAELENLRDQGSLSSGQVQLGANPVGQAMAQKSMDRFNGGDSFMAVVDKLLAQTANAERALKQSIDNYVHTDQGHAAHYRGHQG
jgi:hypothetical protein